MTTLTVTCAWCSSPMGTKEGEGVEGTSHGMCDSCYKKLMTEKGNMKVRNHLLVERDGN